MAQIDPRFGRAIKRIRESKGWTQAQLIERIPETYTEVSSYARVENGRRKPSRRATLAILKEGLQLTDSDRIHRLLALAGYETPNEADVGTASEAEKERPAVIPENVTAPNASVPAEDQSHPAGVEGKLGRRLLTCAAVIATLVLAANAGVEIWFSLASIVLYASLYGISILLETAYWENKPNVWPRGSLVFTFISFTSALALFLDHLSVRTGREYGLVLSLAVFSLAAIAQWFIARGVLPDDSVVGTHTGQAAHLKNTGYFLIVVFLFWPPVFHAVAVLRRAAAAGHLIAFRATLADWIMTSGGIFCLNVRSLIVLLLFLVAFSLTMRGHILDRLPSSPHLNRYTLLFYVRAAVFFVLCIVCIAWFHVALSRLPT